MELQEKEEDKNENHRRKLRTISLWWLYSLEVVEHVRKKGP